MQEISKYLEDCKLPKEIKRPLRSLDEIAHWKGSEYRSFLFYASIVIVKKYFDDPKIYHHFLLYFCAITICMRRDQCAENLDIAETMLLDFLTKFKKIYGVEHFSSNLHNLCHLVDDVRRFGPLDTFSTYPFESKLFLIKKLLRSGNTPLTQVAHRMSELQEANFLLKIKSSHFTFKMNREMKHFDENDCALVAFLNANDSKIFKEIEFPTFMLSTDQDKNKWFMTKEFKVICLKYIIKTSGMNDQIFLYGSALTSIRDYFTHPVLSSQLNIYESECQESPPMFHKLSDLYCKMVKINYDSKKFVFIPLIHTILKT